LSLLGDSLEHATTRRWILEDVGKKKKAKGKDGLRRLSKDQKAELAPVLGERAAALFTLVRLGMVRAPATGEEIELCDRLDGWFPSHPIDRSN
jgi:hypothetical protein